MTPTELLAAKKRVTAHIRGCADCRASVVRHQGITEPGTYPLNFSDEEWVEMDRLMLAGRLGHHARRTFTQHAGRRRRPVSMEIKP
jgi:hypothetical protein